MAKKQNTNAGAGSGSNPGTGPVNAKPEVQTDGYSAETRWTVTKPDGTQCNVMASSLEEAIAKVKG